jgi:hypothetical protein
MQVDVNVLSSTTGTVKLSNLSTGQSMGKTLTTARGSKLCQQNAEWIVQDFTYDVEQVPMSDFGTVVFTNAAPTHSDGSKERLERATVFNVRKAIGTVITCACQQCLSSVRSARLFTLFALLHASRIFT